MPRTDADIEGLINDLDSDETGVLIELIAKLDSVATVDGLPVYTADEITLIGRFQQFVTDYVDDETDDDGDFEDENEDDENSEDIPGTGETEATNEATASETPEPADQNPGYGFGEVHPRC